MLNISAARRAGKRGVELNMAPLIDMIFILLIFFLVTTSFVQETGLDIDKPSAATAVVRESADLVIGITRENRIFMGRREIDADRLRLAVERAITEKPEAEVLIVADTQSATGTVIEVMDACRLAGARAISMAAGIPEQQ
ncbi:ExbD/TolR family protein [Desulfosudis oleivorans]|uniref:Biopolymer transport protein ExbD/TolR n=1 Tax=Desulfosudis oleivorans (strain DSM 6200 / JCM 39069 / Hxd3) TaxID=96561 RepID=A9A0R5_DESOH|nr:biopolymer transporter ExbD [Desulfosudis oleivorans]ABW67540.1 Biopolymer transport protein ExbD/TolR [Desulfosudis oleivorans Hxd3]